VIEAPLVLIPTDVVVSIAPLVSAIAVAILAIFYLTWMSL
jgi:hypothetical protein